MDREAVVCGGDGVAVFDVLHRRGTVTEALLLLEPLATPLATSCKFRAPLRRQLFLDCVIFATRVRCIIAAEGRREGHHGRTRLDRARG
jgi:hypothetical protein